MSNGAMVLYTINPNVRTIADFTDKDRIAVPSVRISFNAMMPEMAAEKLWNDPHRIATFAAFLKRIGSMKSEVGDWKQLFWETACGQRGD